MAGGSQEELKIRTRAHELALAWGRGRAGYVLDGLAAEEPARAALMATFIFEALTAWDPSDSRFPSAFRQALLLRSQGLLTAEEYLELEATYRERFGKRPPEVGLDDVDARMTAALRICEALRDGEAIGTPAGTGTAMFLRPRAAQRRTSPDR